MKNQYAQVCYGKTCVKVEGETARAVNNIVLTVALILAIAAIAKALS